MSENWATEAFHSVVANSVRFHIMHVLSSAQQAVHTIRIAHYSMHIAYNRRHTHCGGGLLQCVYELIYIYIYICVCVCVCVEREREREREMLIRS